MSLTGKLSGIAAGKRGIDQRLKGVHFLLHRLIERVRLVCFGKPVRGDRKAVKQHILKQCPKCFGLKQILCQGAVGMCDTVFDRSKCICGRDVTG